MTIGIILIVSILFLGGLLATLGDRLGTKVGKARLSLFNLRPRQTAVLVTIVTGILISGSTLGILFAMSQPLRRGIFEYDETQRKLRQARRELQSTQAQKAQIEIDLARAQAERALVQQNLDNLNASLQTVTAQKLATEDNLKKTQTQLRAIQENFQQTQVQLREIVGKFQQAQEQLEKVTVQTQDLRSELEKLRTERQELIDQRDEVKSQITQRDEEIAERNELIAERDREIENRNKVIQERESKLKELENQQKFLERQVRIFEQYYQDYQYLRQANLALLRGQILASGVVEVLDPQGSVQAVNRLLEIANQFARDEVKPGTGEVNEQVIQVTPEQVERLQEQIADGQEYAVRLLSAGNYIRGESNVEIFVDVALNQVVFESGEVIATRITNGATMSEEELIEQIETLIESCLFRARRGGILENRLQVGDGSPETLINFVQKIRENPTQITIQAIASETTYTIGPLRIDLVAFAENEELFRISSPESP